MMVTYAPWTGLVLPVVTNTSTLVVAPCLDLQVGSLDLGTRCSSATNNVYGDMLVQLNDPVSPTTIALQNFSFTSTGSFGLTFAWNLGGTPITVNGMIPAGLPVTNSSCR